MAIALQGTPSIYESASASSVVIPYPSGVTAGELLIAVVTDSSGTAPTTNPGGWTLAASQSGPTTAPSITVWYKFATGSESGSVTFATNATAGRVTGTMSRWSGVDQFTPLDTTPVSANSGVTSTFTMPSITTVTDGAMLIHALSMNASALTNEIDTLAGTTQFAVSTGTGRCQKDCYEERATAGATGTRAWTKTNSGTTLQWAGITVALRPDAGGAAPAPVLVQRIVGIPDTNTSTSARVQVKVTNATSVRLKIGTDSGVTTGVVYGSAATPGSNGDATLTATGLSPNTRYYYRVEMTDADSGTSLDTGAVGRLKTAPSGQANFAFDFASCCNATDSASLAAIATRGDDLFFHLGDLYYADGSGTGLANFRSKMNAKITATNHAAVFSTMNMTYTPSDHDGMNNNGTAGDDPTAWSNWNTAKNELFPMPANYYTFVWGRVRFIQIDTRSYKSPAGNTDNSSKTALGTTQKTWLKDLITSATEPVIVIIQGDPWIGGGQDGEDSWSGYVTERTELANHFSSSGKNIVMLAGDMHAVAADSGTNAPGGIAVFHAAPLKNNSSIKGGPYTVSPYPASGTSVVEQYGRCVVTDSGSEISLAFTGYSSDNTSRVTLTKTYSVTQPPLNAAPTSITTGEAFGAPGMSGTVAVKTDGFVSSGAVGTPAATLTATVTPTGIASAAAIGSPTISVPSTTVSPTGIPSAMGLGSPTLSSSTTASPAGIATKKALGSPTLSMTMTVTPTGIATSKAVGTPTINVDNRARPIGIAGAAAVGTPSLSSSTTVRPTGIASKAAAGAPKISMWTVLRPTGIPTKKFVGQPVLRLSSTVRPDGIPSAANLGFPTLVGGGPFKTDYEVTILKKRWKGSIG